MKGQLKIKLADFFLRPRASALMGYLSMMGATLDLGGQSKEISFFSICCQKKNVFEMLLNCF